MPTKHAVTEQPINELLANRWSPRAYNPEKTVSRSHLIAILEAARWAPSCYGDEPWRYLVCDRHRDPEAWQRLHDCLMEANQVWAGNAPVLIAALADTRFSGNDQENRWGGYDTGAASMSLCLQAAAHGLIAHQMGGFSPKALIETFAIPERYQPMAVIAVGHQGRMENLPEKLQQAEEAPRERHPLDQRFFEGSWNEPLDRNPVG